MRAMEFSLRFDDVRGLGQKEPAGCTRRETYSDGAPACPGGFGRVPSCAVRWVCAHPRAELCFASPKLGYMGGTGGYSFTISLARVRHFLKKRGGSDRLGPRLMPPQSQLLAYGPASPVNRSVELVLRSRTSPTRRPVMRSAPEPATRFDVACQAMLASGKASQ